MHLPRKTDLRMILLALFITAAEVITFLEYAWREESVKELSYEGIQFKDIDGVALGRFINLEKLTIKGTSIRSIPDQLWTLTSLTELDLHSNAIESISENVKNLEALKNLDVSSNSLSSLPAEIGELHSLRHLNISTNAIFLFPEGITRLVGLEALNMHCLNITEFPKELTNLKHLEELDISTNTFGSISEGIFSSLNKLVELRMENMNLSGLPEDIGNLKLLEHLDLSQNRFQSVPAGIKGLKNLQSLDFLQNNLEAFPGEIMSELKQLKKLILNVNELESLPKEICDLEHLEELYCSNNCLAEISFSMEKLKRLKKLDLSQNAITTIPNDIECLTSLEDLNLDGNLIIAIPKEIGKLKELIVLDVAENLIDEFPDEIGNLSSLTSFYAHECCLKTLPKTIGKLKKLEEFRLYKNKLDSLPGEVGLLEKLTFLDASENNITEIDGALGNLKNLKFFALNENSISELPSSFINLANSLNLLNLQNNPLNLQGSNGNLGREELVTFFGDHVLLEAFANPDFKPISVEAALSNVRSNEIYWNLNELAALKNNPVPQGTLDEKEFLKLFRKKISSLIAPETNTLMVNYIQKLFNPDMNYLYIPVQGDARRIALDLLEAVLREFLKLLADANREKDAHDKIRSDLREIANAVRNFCPDRQMSEMRFAYNLLRGEMLDEDVPPRIFFVKTVAALKEEIFDIVFTIRDAEQGVHVLNYWKHRLQDALGFDFKFNSQFGTMDQDPYFAQEGNALEAFFKAFTPDIVIGLLTDRLNKSKHAFRNAVQYIYTCEELDEDRKREMVSGDDFEHAVVDRVTKHFIKYYLLKMRLLEVQSF